MTPLWPPPKNILERDRKIAFDAWAEQTKWYENTFSNFILFVKPLVHEGRSYLTAEHFYQAMKSQEPGYRDAIAQCETPSKAKFLARKVNLRPDWEQVKIPIMTYSQSHKINTDPQFRHWLKSSLGFYIYEWNNWGDQFWGIGIYTGEGQNVLGRILMNLREINFGGDIPF